jgi:hypothetical protein
VRAGQAEVDRLGGAGAQRTHLHTRRDVQPVVRVAGRAVTILIQANILTHRQAVLWIRIRSDQKLSRIRIKIILDPDPSSTGSEMNLK